MNTKVFILSYGFFLNFIYYFLIDEFYIVNLYYYEQIF